MKPKFSHIGIIREFTFRYEDEPIVRPRSVEDILIYNGWYERPDMWYCDNWKNTCKRKKQYLRHRKG